MSWWTALVCSVFPFIMCPAALWQGPPRENVYRVETQVTPSETIVRSGADGFATTTILHAPYGVKSEIVSRNGETYATTTPLTEEDIRKMNERQAEVERQMDKMFEDQQWLFDDMWSGL